MRRGVTPDMNVTPLVDVVLVLLIIFMVVTPQLESGAPVELPAARHPDKVPEGGLTPATLSLTARGAFYLEREQVPAAEVTERLRALREKSPDKPVVLKADREVRYAEVRRAFKAMQDLGFPGISLQVVEQKER